MEFLKKNQFKMAAIAVSLLIICIVAILVFQKENQNTTTSYYSVNFEGVEETNISDQIVLKGEKINEPKEPTREGYIFLGWYIGEEKYNFDEEINEDITIEAKWKKDGEEEPEEDEEPEDKDDETTNDDKKPTTGDNKKPTTGTNNNNNNNTNKPSTPDKISVTGITLNKTSLTLDIGKSDTLVATVTPSNATNKNVTWKSSNNNVVTVNNGTIIAVGAGTATITASADGKTVTCTVTVNKKITYTYEWQRIESSSVGEYYLYIVSSEGKKVSGKVNIVYTNGKSKEHDITSSGLKVVKSAVSSVEVISAN